MRKKTRNKYRLENATLIVKQTFFFLCVYVQFLGKYIIFVSLFIIIELSIVTPLISVIQFLNFQLIFINVLISNF